MSRVVVDLAQLGDLVDRLDAFQRHLTSVEQEVAARARILHETWTGRAAMAHELAQARWETGATEAQAALATLHSIAVTAHANYAAAAQVNRRMWAM